MLEVVDAHGEVKGGVTVPLASMDDSQVRRLAKTVTLTSCSSGRLDVASDLVSSWTPFVFDGPVVAQCLLRLSLMKRCIV